MASEGRSQVHEMGLKLAEAGRHEEALGHIREHLRRYPNDSQALNDIGVILYCMGANEEAIDHLERARGLCSEGEAAEINWNLCEAYLGAGYPGPAMKLFDEMERQEILSADLLNRGANAFLAQDMYGHAIELLIRSLGMAPSQEILKPMIEVIRSRRPRVGVFAAERNEGTQRVFEFIGQRFTAALHTGAGREEMRSWLEQCEIAFFDGCWETLIEVSYLPARCRFIVRLSDEDVYTEGLGNICWQNIDTVVVSDNPVIKDRLLERFGEFDGRVRVVAAGRGVDTKRFGFAAKGRGKRIACLDDLTLRSNPMLLLQCMQKLHYIDRDYRLYFAGRFADGAVEDYVRHAVEELELSDVVFFDGGMRSEAAWLRDKHYVATAAITADGLAGVLKGMSCGLKPVVHSFPGAREMVDGEFLFTIAEDFCGQVLSERYEPRRYRELVEARYSEAGRFRVINDVLFRLEKEVVREEAGGATLEAPATYASLQWLPPAAVEAPAVEPIRVEPVETYGPAGGSYGPAGGEPVAESPQIAWAEENDPALQEPRPGWPGHRTAPEHLCDRVGSINQMSADILRDWKAFAETQEGRGDARAVPIEGAGLGEDVQPLEVVSTDAGWRVGGLKISGPPGRRRVKDIAGE